MKNTGESWDIKKTVLLFLNALVIICFIYASFTGSLSHFHSDSASANLYAKEQMLSASFFPKGWYHPSDLWIFSINLFIIPLSYLISDAMVVRSISVIILAVITGGAVILFHKSVFKNDGWLLSLPILFSGISGIYLEMVISQGAYLVPLLYICITFILFFKSISNKFEIISLQYFSAFLCWILFVGLTGLRYLQVITIPIICTIIIMYLLNHMKDVYSQIKKTLFPAVFLSGIVTFFMLFGFLMFLIIKSNVNYVSGMTNPANISLEDGSHLQENLGRLCSGLLSLFGFAEGVSLLSFSGLLSFFRIMVMLGVLVFIPVCLIITFKKEPFAIQFIAIFSLVSSGITIYLLLFMSNMWENTVSIRYFLPQLMLIFILEAAYLYEHINSLAFLLKTVIIIFAVTWISTNCLDLIRWCRYYDSAILQKKEITNFLQSQDLHYGYATYWNAGVNTVLSQYNVEVNAVNINDAAINPHRWLSSERWYQPNNHEGNTFLMLTNEENTIFDTSQNNLRLGEPKEILEYGNFVIRVYPYNIAQRGWIADLDYGSKFVISSHSAYDNKVQASKDGLLIEPNGKIFGPWLDIQPGEYICTIILSDVPSNQTLLITSDSGQTVLFENIVQNGKNEIPFRLEQDRTQVEFILSNNTNMPFTVQEITLQKRML